MFLMYDDLKRYIDKYGREAGEIISRDSKYNGYLDKTIINIKNLVLKQTIFSPYSLKQDSQIEYSIIYRAKGRYEHEVYCQDANIEKLFIYASNLYARYNAELKDVEKEFFEELE